MAGSVTTETFMNTEDTTVAYTAVNVTSPTNLEASKGERCGTWTAAYHLTSALVLCGVVGNMVAIAVLLRPRFRHLSTAVYLLTLAVSDTCYLLFKLLQYMSDVLNYHTFEGFWPCRISRFLDLNLLSFSNWIIVLVTLERVMYACLPIHLSGRWCTRMNAILQIVFFIMLNYYVNCGIIAILEENCLLSETRKDLFTRLIFATSTLLPGIFIYYGSTLLTIQLVCIRRSQPGLRRVPQGSNIRLTGLIIANIANFLLFHFPLQLFSLILINGHHQHLLTHATCIRTILFILNIANHSVNPYLYALSGTLYRQELRTLLRCCCRRNHQTGPPSTRMTRMTRLSNVTSDLAITSEASSTVQNIYSLS